MNRSRLLMLPILAIAAVLATPFAAEEKEDEPEDPRAEDKQVERRAEGMQVERILAEIEVTASYSLNRDEPVSGVALSQEEILRLPHFGDDLYRAMSVMPGIAGNDVSAQFNVRGGFYRDTALRIDGIEIYEPYHLKVYGEYFYNY